MRILVAVSGQQWLGGLTLQSALLCRELERMGHEIAVVSVGADAPVDQFPYARVRHGEPQRNGELVRSGMGTVSPGKGGQDGKAGKAGEDGEYVFRYEVVAHASRYIPAAPEGVRRALAPGVRGAMALMGRPARGQFFGHRSWATAVASSVYAALSGNSTRETVEAGFLSRLLLQTDAVDLQRLDEIRRWFRPDVDYACELSLVPMLARLEDRGIPLVAAAQGFELVARRGVALLEALRDCGHRLDLILSGSQANVEENLPDLMRTLGRDVPARAIPYGVATDTAWEMSRDAARRHLAALSRRRVESGNGFGDLWGGGPMEGPDAPLIVASLSRLDVEKGTDLPLHALAILRREGLPVRLWIAGSMMPGAFLDVLQSKIRMMDLGNDVNLIGTLPTSEDKVAYLRAADAFVAGFIRSEPFGLVYSEAFAAGLPVVGPQSGAAPELLGSIGETRLLYPENDTGALASRIKLLLDSPALRADVARKQRDAFCTRYNATSMAEAAAAEFERAIQERGGKLHQH